jgi:hypothetical protein
MKDKIKNVSVVKRTYDLCHVNHLDSDEESNKCIVPGEAQDDKEAAYALALEESVVSTTGTQELLEVFELPEEMNEEEVENWVSENIDLDDYDL